VPWKRLVSRSSTVIRLASAYGQETKPPAKKTVAVKKTKAVAKRRRNGPRGARTVRRVGLIEAPPLAVG
jgi:hypothetical protein